MFGLFRLPILLIIAFISGIFYERTQASETCVQAGGQLINGLCER